MLDITNTNSNDHREINFIDCYQSPNFTSRISSIVLHHTGNQLLEHTINLFLESDGLSSHFLVDRDGTIYRLVQEEDRAFHAGVSAWKNRSNLNDTSIGIEMQNNATEDFPPEQENAVAHLCKYLVDKYDILPQNIVAHGDVALGRKFDPSGYYNWKTLYDYLGFFPGLYETSLSDEEKSKVVLNSSSPSSDIMHLQQNLERFGYKITPDGHYGRETENVVTAFNRHFANDCVFVKETVENHMVVTNPKNALWYRISEERLQKLIKMV